MQDFTGNSSDLQRVAFIMGSGSNKQRFDFEINPDNMTENFAARNVFLQPEYGIQMQGFGPGLHTITIAGTTGVRKLTGVKRLTGSKNEKPYYKMQNTAGFDKYHEMFNFLQKQLDSVHDNQTTSEKQDTIVTFGGLDLDYMDYTNEHYYHCELAPQGYTFTQTADNPLSYRYEINLIVIGNAKEAATNEKSWLNLGNKQLGISTAKLRNAPDKKSVALSDKYSRELDDLRANNYKMLRTTAKNILKNMESRGVSGFRSPIINYGDGNKKFYRFHKSLSSSQIAKLYSKVYTGITTQVHLKVSGKEVVNLKISESNPTAWNAYWKKYVSSAMVLKDHNGVLDYGQTGSDASQGKDDSYDTDSIGKELYGNTVPTIDLSAYADTESTYKQLFGNVLSQFNAASYTAAAKAFSGSLESTIMNYGQLDTQDTQKVLGPYDVNAIYNELYSSTVPGLDYSQYLTMGELYVTMRGGDPSSISGSQIAGDETDPATSNTIPDVDTASDIYNILYGNTLNSENYNNFIEDLDAYNNDPDALIDDYTGDQASVITDDDGTEYSIGTSDYTNDNYDSAYENDNYYNRIVDEVDPTVDQWTQATTQPAEDSSSLYPLPGDNTADIDNLSSKVTTDSTGYINPQVSANAPLLGYNEISNILKVDESTTA